MSDVVEEYFRSIFTSSRPTNFDRILQGIHPAISEDAAGFLSHEFHANEVWIALKQISPLTALGPDGMSPIFYKSF